jgi:HAE1 family hydrophobic/amphiphilic exporter-1
MFRLAQLSLRNRAVVLLTTIAITIGGVLSMSALKQELIPSLEIPMAGVIGTYPGTAANIMEQQVAEPIETAIRGVSGVESIQTTSMNSVAISIVEFRYGTNMDAANQRLTTAVTRIAAQLPADVTTNVITGSMDDLPVLQLAVSGIDGGLADPTALATTVDSVLVPRLRELPDIRSVDVSGYAAQQITITLDSAAMAAHGVTADKIANVLTANGLSLPIGTITEGDTTLTAQIGQPLASVDDLAEVPVAPGATGAPPVRLSDVATVVQAAADATSYSRLDGAEAVAVAVTKTPAGNTVDVSHAVQDVLADLDQTLEARGLRVAIVFDQAPFIEESIAGLTEEGLLGLGFAIIIILVFLLSVRATLVSAISIPLSLLTTFIVMRATGETLNLLTLGAMTIAIGRIVDDSIVVIENIKRHLSYGEPKREAIIGAVKEVGGAIAASTVCTVAVFAPIAFVGGMVGELFLPFGLTVAIALVASLIVALTIVPVLAYWFVKSPVSIDAADRTYQRELAENKERHGLWQRAYLPTLRGALGHPVVTLLIAVLLLGGTAGLATRLETNFLDNMGQDTVTVTETFQPSTALEVQDIDARAIEDALLALPEVATVQTTIGGGGLLGISLGGTTSSTFAITLAEDADAVAAQDTIRDAVADLGGPRSTGITVGGSEAMMGSTTIDLIVRAPDTAALAEAARLVEEVARSTEGATDVTNNLAADAEGIQITVNRDLAMTLGMTETQVEGLVASIMSARPIGTLDTDDGRMTVRVSSGAGPATLTQLKALPLAQGPTGRPLTLTDIATVEVVTTPVSLTRVDGERSATVSVTPASQDLGQLSGRITDAVDELDLPAGATVEVGGVAAQQSDAFSDLGVALLIAIAIVFIVMVATFGSLLQPLILLISIPFAATGALIALLVADTALSVPALIGVLMLIGIVVSNAIVLIDLINQYRQRGRDLDEAIIEGARKRLRPIVMTAGATIFALAPMAIGLTGGGAFISQPLALVVIGGLVTSTLMTLIVVPVLYRFEARAHDQRAARREVRLAERRAQRVKDREARLAAAAGHDEGTAP